MVALVANLCQANALGNGDSVKWLFIPPDTSLNARGWVRFPSLINLFW